MLSIEIVKHLHNNPEIVNKERYYYDYFDVIIVWFHGMFEIELVGGWDEEYDVPEFMFHTDFKGGFDQAVKATLDDIRKSKENYRIKNYAESALARACMEFHIKHCGLL